MQISPEGAGELEGRRVGVPQTAWTGGAGGGGAGLGRRRQASAGVGFLVIAKAPLPTGNVRTVQQPGVKLSLISGAARN